jgi:hypothetical protein
MKKQQSAAACSKQRNLEQNPRASIQGKAQCPSAIPLPDTKQRPRAQLHGQGRIPGKQVPHNDQYPVSVPVPNNNIITTAAWYRNCIND